MNTMVRDVEGLRVEIQTGLCRFPAPGAMWEMAPGVVISVQNPENSYVDPATGVTMYDEYVKEQFYAPGKSVFDATKKNKIGQMGAWVFQWDWENFERWLAPRVERLVQRAHAMRLQADQMGQLAARIKREATSGVTVELPFGEQGVEVAEGMGMSRMFTSVEEWESHGWEFRS